MKEDANSQNNNEVVFNSMLRSGRNQIARAFGRLKARWSVNTIKEEGFKTRKSTHSYRGLFRAL